MTKYTLPAVASLLAANMAFAGNTVAPAEDPVLTPAAPVATTPNWTGFYVGGQLGYANVDTNVAGVDGDDIIGGFVAGYDYDLGNWVVGAGLDYDFADIGLAPGVSVENVFRVKLRGGYKIGNGLLYATGGYANADTSTLGDDDGYFIGAGYEHLISDQFSLGGELLYHEFDNFNSTAIDVEATTIQLRGTFRF
ncbi:outer membrane protein [Roseovarius phycicola]|uniref:Outer membrane beta-barrel protein n=1 Tax=Roseovarius phycicola TaxID=3080976 RepID=A0ABZ2HNW1_9RHOB